jgi:hypothetical protein
MSWNLNLGYKTKSITGMDWKFWRNLDPVDRSSLIYGIDPQHTYNTISFGGKIDFNESIINEASMNFNRFTDALGSAENSFISNLLYSSMLWMSRLKQI